jgi:hypothetical protein
VKPVVAVVSEALTREELLEIRRRQGEQLGGVLLYSREIFRMNKRRFAERQGPPELYDL